MADTITNTSDILQYLNQGNGNPWANLQDLGTIISAVVQTIMIVAAVIFFILIVLSGISLMTSSGDKEAVSRARQKLTNALIGMVVVLAVWAIINFVEYFFGIKLFGS